MEEKVVVLRRFNSPFEANIVKGLLEANGISCFLSDESTIGLNPIFDPVLGGVRLQIMEKDLDLAEQILKANPTAENPEEDYTI